MNRWTYIVLVVFKLHLMINAKRKKNAGEENCLPNIDTYLSHGINNECICVQSENKTRKAIWLFDYLQVFRSMDSCCSRPGPEGNTPDHMTRTRRVHFNVHPSTVLVSWTKLPWQVERRLGVSRKWLTGFKRSPCWTAQNDCVVVGGSGANVLCFSQSNITVIGNT